MKTYNKIRSRVNGSRCCDNVDVNVVNDDDDEDFDLDSRLGCWWKQPIGEKGGSAQTQTYKHIFLIPSSSEEEEEEEKPKTTNI